MDFDPSSSAQQDSTKVFRIMGDFREFMSSQRHRSGTDTNAVSISSIPFRLPLEEGPKESAENDVSSNIAMRVKIKKLEAEYASSEKAHIKANIELEAQCEKLKSQRLQLEEKCEQLQTRLNKLTAQSIEMHDDLQQMHKDKNAEMLKWESNYMNLEKLKQESDSRLESHFEQLNYKNSQLSEQSLMFQLQNTILNLKLEESAALIKQQNSRLETASELVQSHQETTSKLVQSEQQLRELKSRLEKMQDTEAVANAFKEDMYRFRQMEQNYRNLHEENIELRKNQENCSLLNEKLMSVEAKLNRAETQSARVPMLVEENEALTRKLLEVEHSSVGIDVYQTMKFQFESLKNQLASCEENNSLLKADLEEMTKNYREENVLCKRLDEKISQQGEITSSINLQLLRLRKRAGLLSKERDSLREILQSYDAELTMTSHTTQLQKRIDNAEDANRKLHKRIEELEEENKQILEKAMMNKLRVRHLEMASHSDQGSSSPGLMRSNDLEIAALKEKVEEFDAENKRLQEKNERLEALIEQGKLKGDYNPETTKIIHFAMNPADLAHMKAKQCNANLEEECARLRQKLKDVEEGHEVSMVEVESMKAAKDQVHMAELRNQRLKEIFTKKVQEFRQACYSLTGYRIDSSADAQFKLVSMFAESEADYLLFQMMDNGEMQLLETEYSKSLAELISLHLHHQNSIPMFLSALSVNLYSQQTLME